MKRRKRVLTANAAHCMRCGRQTDGGKCECGCCARTEEDSTPPGYIPGPTAEAHMTSTGDHIFDALTAGDPPGYIPSFAANLRRMEPIPDVPWDFGECDGLVTNEGAPGGVPEAGIDWAALSGLPPDLCRK